MKSFLWTGAATALFFAASASAAVCPVNTWCFGGNPGFVTQGATYSIGLGTVTAYSEQVYTSTGDIVSTIDGSPSHPTLGTGANAMFQTNDSVFDEGIGLAPYNPAEGSGSSFSNQDGISDHVTEVTGHQNTSYSNIIELKLGSNIAAGTSLAFLLQAGIGASSDQVSVFYKDGSSPLNANSTSMNFKTTTPLGAISTNGTTSQFTITKDTNGDEMVAIIADCHYILLDTITGSSTVPEPRFYGILLAGLLGVAGMVYQRRRAAQANA